MPVRWKSHRALPRASGSYFPAKQIAKGLWIGSEGDARNPGFFKKHGVRLVVNATANIDAAPPAGVALYRVRVNDDPSDDSLMLQSLPGAVVAIDDVIKHGGSVLVHCRAGMQRSATVVAAYLMWSRGWSADKAIEFINAKKHETFWPVPTFSKALGTWEAQLARGNYAR